MNFNREGLSPQTSTKFRTNYLHPSSVAAATNYHKLSGSKRHNFLPHSPRGRKSDVGHRRLITSRRWQGRIPFGGPMSLPFPASGGRPHSRARGPFLHLRSQQQQAKSFSCCHHLSGSLSSTYGDPRDDRGPTQMTQGDLPSQGKPMSNLSSTCSPRSLCLVA